MPTAALLFLALLSIYVAASGRAKKVLEALGASPGNGNGQTNAVPDTSGQGSPQGTTETSNNLLNNNAAMYNTKLNNPGALLNSNNPAYQTNYGLGSLYELTGSYRSDGQLQDWARSDPTAYGMGPVQYGGKYGFGGLSNPNPTPPGIWNPSSYQVGSIQQTYPQYFSSIAGQ